MAYRKDNYDPNYQMSGEDMRKHRRLNLALVPLFLVFTMMNMSVTTSAPWSQWTMQVAWGVYVLLVVATLTGLAYKFWAGSEFKILEDETAVANRADAMQWGWVATILVALTLFFITPFTPNLDAREAVAVLLMVAIITTSLRFVILEKDDDEEE